MAHLGVVGTKIQSSSATVAAVTLTEDVPVGATVLLGIAWDAPAPGSSPTITSVTDSSGNAWPTTPDVATVSDDTVAVAVLRTRVATQLDTGDTISVTISAARGRWAMQADAWDDIDASPLDETAATIPDPAPSGSALSTTATAETGGPYRLLYCVFGFGGGRTATAPDGWTGAAKVETAAGSGNRALQVTHRYVAAADEYEGTLTLSSSSTYAAAIATYAYTPPDPGDPVALVSQVAVEAPNPGDAPVARIAHVALTTPQAAAGEVRVSQVGVTVPAGDGAPYTGLKIARGGGWWNAGVHVLG